MILHCSFGKPDAREGHRRKVVVMRYGEVQKEKQRYERIVVTELNIQGNDSLGEMHWQVM